MSNRAPKMDFGSLIALLISLVLILAVVYFLVTSLINTYNRNSTKGEVDGTHLVQSAADNLKPIGSSATVAVVKAAPAAARSGEEVYTAVCTVCHKTGVAGAPIVGDKAAWEPRVATGIDALMTTAINGKGAMPARAGQNVNDVELKAAIIYMASQAGFDLGGGSAPEKADPAPAVEPATEPPAEEMPKAEAPEAPKEPEAPKAPAMVEEVAPAAAVVATAASSGLDGKVLYVSKGCGACHGADAKTPIMPLYPKIAGQGSVYVAQQLLDIKSGKRNNGQTVVMKGIMAGVSEEESAAIAEYISTLR